MYARTKQRRFWARLVLALVVLLPLSASPAENTPEHPLEKVAIAYSSISGNMAPLWITHERGFFRKYGLDVQLVFIESGSTTVQSLISKDVSFAQMAGAGVLQSRLRGSDVVMIAGVINTLTFKFFVDRSIKQADQLRGKTLAVTRYGSSPAQAGIKAYPAPAIETTERRSHRPLSLRRRRANIPSSPAIL